jgi:hypothetical protein
MESILWNWIKWIFERLGGILVTLPLGMRISRVFKYLQLRTSRYLQQNPIFALMILCLCTILVIFNPEWISVKYYNACHIINDDQDILAGAFGDRLIFDNKARECQDQEPIGFQWFHRGMLDSKHNERNFVSSSVFFDGRSTREQRSNAWYEFSAYFRSNIFSFDLDPDPIRSTFVFEKNTCRRIISAEDSLGVETEVERGLILKSNWRSNPELKSIESKNLRNKEGDAALWEYCNTLNPNDVDPSKLPCCVNFCEFVKYEIFVPTVRPGTWCGKKTLIERWLGSSTWERNLADSSQIRELRQMSFDTKSKDETLEISDARWNALTEKMPKLCLRAVNASGDPLITDAGRSDFSELGRISSAWCDFK